VYQEIGGHAYATVYPGPVGSVLTPGLRGIAHFHELPNASSLCGACREVCPVRIDIPRMLLALRATAVKDAPESVPQWLRTGMKVFRWMAVRPALFKLAGKLGSISTRRMAKDGWVKELPGPLAAWTKARDFPAMAPKSFSAQWRARGGSRPSSGSTSGKSGKSGGSNASGRPS
jgi:L-lactate dehydrogenase complex protein LldF